MLDAIKNYFFQLALCIDQGANALTGGFADETLSSRAHRMREKGQPVWGWTAAFIDALFFWQKDHCLNAWRSEVLRSQMPPEFRGSVRRPLTLLEVQEAMRTAYTASPDL